MSFIEILGQQAAAQGAGGVISEGMGLLTQGMKNKQQARQQKRLTNIQIDAQKHMGDFNFKKQMELWEKTGYGAQVKQMQEAGLNPAMLYGMGGAGGQSTSINAGTAGGGTAGVATGAHGEGMGMMPLIKAQVDNINMDTYKKKVEADKLSGVDTELGKTQIASLTQGINNQKAQEALTNTLDSIQKNELFEKYTTQDWRFIAYEHEMRIKIDQARSALAQANVDESTVDSKIEILAQEAIGQMLKNAYTGAQIQKTDAEIKKIVNDITLGWSQLDNEQQKTRIQKYTAEFQANHPGVMQVLGGAIQRLADTIAKPINTNKVN